MKKILVLSLTINCLGQLIVKWQFKKQLNSLIYLGEHVISSMIANKEGHYILY